MVTRQAATAAETELHNRMHAAHMYGLWELASQMTRHPEPDAPGDDHDDVALEYTHPQTGRALLRTMACWVQMLRPGARLKAHRHTGSAVYYVVEGEGETIIDGSRFQWGRGTSSRSRPGRFTSTPTSPRATPPSSSRSRTGRCSRRSGCTGRKRWPRTAVTRR